MFKLKSIVFLIATTIFCLSLFGQNINNQDNHRNFRILYEMRHLYDSTDVNSQRLEIMELRTNGYYSVFRSVINAFADSLSNGLNPKERFSITGSVTKYNIYKDIVNQDINYYDGIRIMDRNLYYYNENMKGLEWDIQMDTAKINGLNCQKALLNYGGREWTAWFAQDVPINDGPYKFSNLPGLIVLMHDEKDSWTFEIKSISIVTDSIPKAPNRKNGLKLKKEEYYSMKNSYKENAVEIEEASGNSIFIFKSEQHRNDIIQGRRAASRKNNNWIELYPLPSRGN